jgi:hypothetical protein
MPTSTAAAAPRRPANPSRSPSSRVRVHRVEWIGVPPPWRPARSSSWSVAHEPLAQPVMWTSSPGLEWPDALGAERDW